MSMTSSKILHNHLTTRHILIGCLYYSNVKRVEDSLSERINMPFKTTFMVFVVQFIRQWINMPFKTTFMVYVVQFITQWINMPPRPLSWSRWSSLSHNGSTCPQYHFHGLCGPVDHNGSTCPPIPLSWSMWSSLSHSGSTCPQDHFHGLCGPVYQTMDQHALNTTFMVYVVQFITQWTNMPP